MICESGKSTSVMREEWYAPLLVLLAGGAWLGWQQLEISRLDQSLASSAGQGSTSLIEDPKLYPDAPYSYLDSSGKVDLVMLSSAAKGELSDDGNMINGIRAGIRLKLELQKMSVGDLLDLSDQIPGLQLPEDERQKLQSGVWALLASKSPRDALHLMSGEINSHFNLIKVALTNLSPEDPRAVVAWIDQHRDQLRADSKRLSTHSSRILKLEETLAPHLLKLDPDAMHGRMQKLTPREADTLLSSLSNRRGDPDLLKSVVKLARRSKRSEFVAGNLTFHFSRDDLGAATRFMNQRELVGTERDAFILGVSTNFGAQEKEDLSHLDELYQWLQGQPEEHVAPMSRALVTSYHMNDSRPKQYQRTVAKIAEFGGTSASNELLKKFAQKTVCIPTCPCHNSLEDRLESLQDPDLKRALAEAHKLVLQENSEKK